MTDNETIIALDNRIRGLEAEMNMLSSARATAQPLTAKDLTNIEASLSIINSRLAAVERAASRAQQRADKGVDLQSAAAMLEPLVEDRVELERDLKRHIGQRIGASVGAAADAAAQAKTIAAAQSRASVALLIESARAFGR